MKRICILDRKESFSIEIQDMVMIVNSIINPKDIQTLMDNYDIIALNDERLMFYPKCLINSLMYWEKKDWHKFIIYHPNDNNIQENEAYASCPSWFFHEHVEDFVIENTNDLIKSYKK